MVKPNVFSIISELFIYRKGLLFLGIYPCRVILFFNWFVLDSWLGKMQKDANFLLIQVNLISDCCASCGILLLRIVYWCISMLSNSTSEHLLKILKSSTRREEKVCQIKSHRMKNSKKNLEYLLVRRGELLEAKIRSDSFSVNPP